MIALTTLVTKLWPALTSPGGCSLTRWLGITHETAGSVPRFAIANRCLIGTMLRSSWSALTVSNHGSGFQIPGVPAFCFDRLADHAAVVAVGLGALDDEVAPGDVVLVQQVGEIGPRVDRLAAGRVLRLVRRGQRVLDRVDAARRRVRAAAGRPFRDHEQVRRQAPRGVRLEHVVLQHEVARVGPVVRDLARVVVAHHVRVRRAERAQRRVGVDAAADAQPAPGLAHEAVHLPAVDVADRVEVLVRAAAVAVAGVVVRVEADSAAGIRRADGEVPAAPRQAVRSRVRAEVGVERAVLLHDHDDVADLVDPRQGVGVRLVLVREEGDSRDQRDRERERKRKSARHERNVRRSG